MPSVAGPHVVGASLLSEFLDIDYLVALKSRSLARLPNGKECSVRLGQQTT